MALQVTKAINEYGGQPNSRMSSAMVPLVTNDLYSQDLYFTTPYMDVEDETVHAKLAIVVNSSSVSNLFLDDESIDVRFFMVVTNHVRVHISTKIIFESNHS